MFNKQFIGHRQATLFFCTKNLGVGVFTAMLEPPVGIQFTLAPLFSHQTRRRVFIMPPWKNAVPPVFNHPRMAILGWFNPILGLVFDTLLLFSELVCWFSNWSFMIYDPKKGQTRPTKFKNHQRLGLDRVPINRCNYAGLWSQRSPFTKLVGGIPTPLKTMISSVGMILPNIWKVIKFHGSKPPSRL